MIAEVGEAGKGKQDGENKEHGSRKRKKSGNEWRVAQEGHREDNMDKKGSAKHLKFDPINASKDEVTWP